MANRITGIDHTLLGVADLEKAREVYSRLGFTLTPRGSHIGWGTANYCIMFPENYVELLGIVDPAGFSAGLDETLARQGEGLIGIALGTDDADAARASLAARGLDPSATQNLARNLELPDGTVRPCFELVHLPEGATAGTRMFLCRHLTPDLLRRSDWLVHANAASRLASVAVVVDEPEPLAEGMEALFGSGAVTATDDTLAVFTGGTAIFFVTPTDLELLCPDINRGSERTTPYIAGMAFETESPDRTVTYFADCGVPHSVSQDGILRVAPADACGAILEFAPRAAETVWALNP